MSNSYLHGNIRVCAHLLKEAFVHDGYRICGIDCPHRVKIVLTVLALQPTFISDFRRLRFNSLPELFFTILDHHFINHLLICRQAYIEAVNAHHSETDENNVFGRLELLPRNNRDYRGPLRDISSSFVNRNRGSSRR